jgi:predicted ATPase
VGREDDLARLARCCRAADDADRAGGTGKTRPAVEVEHAAADAVFVDLAGRGRPALRDRGKAFGIRFGTGGSPPPWPGRRRQAVMIILDRCEHLLDRCAAFVQELLTRRAGCGCWRSRERLGLPGASSVRPLALASSTRRGGRSRLTAGLAQARAAAQPGFAITAETQRGRRDRRRLDGLPSRWSWPRRGDRAPPALALDRLDDRFRLLDAASRAPTTASQPR